MDKIKLFWNEICNIFGIMGIKNGHITKNGIDTGVRATLGGKLYVEKKIFFKREDVKSVLRKVMGSEELKAHMSTNKK